MSKVFNITDGDNWFIGEDKNILIDVYDSAGATQAMTGWALTWELKAAARSTSALISLTTAGLTITIGDGDGSDNRATIIIDDTDTEALKPGTYYHQLRRTDSLSEQILSHGSAVLKESGL